MQAVLDRVIEEYRRKLFLEAANAEYAALRLDADAWAEHQEERALWDATLLDGLDTDELWTADGEVTGQNARSAVGE
jgi:hypothetical protein